MHKNRIRQISTTVAFRVIRGPTRLRLDLRSKFRLILGENDGTLVMILRDLCVTYPATSTGIGFNMSEGVSNDEQLLGQPQNSRNL
jgi:hypothetical protein